MRKKFKKDTGSSMRRKIRSPYLVSTFGIYYLIFLSLFLFKYFLIILNFFFLSLKLKDDRFLIAKSTSNI